MWARQSLGAAYLLNGECREAQRLLAEADTLATDLRLFRPALAPLAEAHLALGDTARAGAIAAEAVAVGMRSGSALLEYRGQVAVARVVLRVAGVAGREAAETALARASALAEQMEARLFEPEILTLRAELAQLGSDEEGRARALREAEHLCHEMGLPARAERIRAALESS
jgi:hypothetical protein